MARGRSTQGQLTAPTSLPPGRLSAVVYSGTRNARTVWNIATEPFLDAHFATFPRKLVERCLRAGCPEQGTVLDPFCGSGTTGWVAQRLGLSFIGIELNSEYAAIAKNRIKSDMPLFAPGDA